MTLKPREYVLAGVVLGCALWGVLGPSAGWVVAVGAVAWLVFADSTKERR